MHRLDQKSEFFGQFLAYALDAPHQLAALRAVDQRDQPIADLETDEVDRLDVIPGQLPLFGGDVSGANAGGGGCRLLGGAPLAQGIRADGARRRP